MGISAAVELWGAIPIAAAVMAPACCRMAPAMEEGFSSFSPLLALSLRCGHCSLTSQ